MRDDSTISTLRLYFARVFVYRGGATQGPFSLYKLKNELDQLGEFELSVMAWHEGAAGWQRLSEVIEISTRLRQRVIRWVLAPVFLGVGALAALAGSRMLALYQRGEFKAESAEEANLAVVVLFVIAGGFILASLLTFLGKTWPMDLIVSTIRREASDN